MGPPADHDASLRFSYSDQRRARIVERAIGVEVGDIDDDRSSVTVDREGSVVEVHARAADLVALRASCNSWTRLIDVADAVCDHADARSNERARSSDR